MCCARSLSLPLSFLLLSLSLSLSLSPLSLPSWPVVPHRSVKPFRTTPLLAPRLPISSCGRCCETGSTRTTACDIRPPRTTRPGSRRAPQLRRCGTVATAAATTAAAARAVVAAAAAERNGGEASRKGQRRDEAAPRRSHHQRAARRRVKKRVSSVGRRAWVVVSGRGGGLSAEMRTAPAHVSRCPPTPPLPNYFPCSFLVVVMDEKYRRCT